MVNLEVEGWGKEYCEDAREIGPEGKPWLDPRPHWCHFYVSVRLATKEQAQGFLDAMGEFTDGLLKKQT